jgi:hypothetical protein
MRDNCDRYGADPVKIKLDFDLSQMAKGFKKVEDGKRYSDLGMLRTVGNMIRGDARNLTAKKGKQKKPEDKFYRKGPEELYPSKPGKPYHRGSGMLRGALVYDPDTGRGEVKVGYSRFGDVAELHELGGTVQRLISQAKYPARPALEPARQRTIKRLFEQERFYYLYRHFFERSF